MTTTEHTINDTLAAILRSTRYDWRDPNVIQAEQLRVFQDSAERPDLLVLEQHVSPVIVETEIFPALTVEAETVARLGKVLRHQSLIVLSAIALRLPQRIRDYQTESLYQELSQATDLEMALYTGHDAATCTRWPREGWIIGTVFDLSRLVQLASIPPEIVDQIADEVENCITGITGQLKWFTSDYPAALQQMSQLLHQENSLQTWRMAAAILVNAFVFHELLVGADPNLPVQSLENLRHSKKLLKPLILDEWDKILAFNYWPIFHIAQELLFAIPLVHSQPLMEQLIQATLLLFQNYLMRSHDLMGTVFQRLIADRKFLAAFYTTPASATLLAGLAIRPGQRAWGEVEVVKSLRIADFACGTGTLLSTVYQRINQLHEIGGGSAKVLHAHMMAHALVGCDVLPSAAHLTASMLTGLYPLVKYDQSSIFTVAYGKQPSGEIALGSLDLLTPQGKFEILSITAKAAEGLGETDKDTWRSLPHASFDVVIMNPPFTRATVHEGQSLNVPNPMFAAFGSTTEEQRAMAEATKRLTQGSSAHGNAGEASIFLALADRKLKAGGILALVMPLSLLSGESWENSRQLLAQNYDQLIIVSLTGLNNTDISFSADTNMGECLVVGRKTDSGSTRATFVILQERPANPLVGASAAEQICQLLAKGNVRQLEDGPLGGTPIKFGKEGIGQLLEAPLPESGGWHVARIADISLAQTAYQLAIKQQVWLPTMPKTKICALPIVKMSAISQLGPIHRDINGMNYTGELRGPFEIAPLSPHTVPTYPVLWAHNAKVQRAMVFEADSEGLARRGATPKEQAMLDLKLENVWQSASHCHFNYNFRFNSQCLNMQFTTQKTIGGPAWISVQLATVEQEKALVLWANTSLGLLLRWWHSNKQQSGRGGISKMALQTMPVLDVTALSEAQLQVAVTVFEAMCQQPLLPLHQLDQDPTRCELDEQFARQVLGWPDDLLTPLALIRQKLSHEPSIRGQK